MAQRRPSQEMRLTDHASLHRDPWHRVPGKCDFAFAASVTQGDNESEADALLQLLDETEEAIDVLRRILEGEG